MKCEIIRDLFPSYVDGLTSKESNEAIEEHLENCGECTEILGQMKEEMPKAEVEVNKKDIKPFKKLNKIVLKSVLITLGICLLLVGAYVYFFFIGWEVKSDDMKIDYYCDEENIYFDFELTNDMCLNDWSEYGDPANGIVKSFRQCYATFLDDRGEDPGSIMLGVSYRDEEGNIKEFTSADILTLDFADGQIVYELEDIAEELGIK